MKNPRHNYYNPKILVKSENSYSIIARTEFDKRLGYPFCRYSKRKDANGEFVITRCRKKVYRDKWQYIERDKCSGID
ncbi:hypothetical protein BTB_502p02880 (plasmid) [Bacillus thuringiensis Bt407]|nr:hypothetical protein BTB_502p02880 [Bacillus thuringiensis Bt407]ERI01231.1 hypothetical protein BTCBT_002786 [Bacillus thuringiensis T01-328]PQZ78304.1 hypothetical protein CQ064_09470 [Bacillus sp. MYb78]